MTTIHTVYIVMHDMGYDGATVEGVFATLPDAIEAAKSLASRWRYEFNAESGNWHNAPYASWEVRIDSAQLGLVADPTPVKVTL